MKNKIKTLILTFLVALLTFTSLFFFLKYKRADDLNSPFIINKKSNNFNKILGEKDRKYTTTSDANVKGLIERYLRLDFIGNKRILGDDRFENSSIIYYNDFIFLAGKGGFIGELSLYVTDQEIKSECKLFGIESIKTSSSIIASGYPQQENINQEKGFCIFDKENPAILKYLNLTSKLKENETFVKGSEAYQNIYSYSIDEVKREITAKVFDKNKKDDVGYSEYVRDITFKY